MLKLHILLLVLLLVALGDLLLVGARKALSDRIGDIVINDQLSPIAQFSWEVDVPKVRDTQIYDMLARYFGTPRVNLGNELKLNIDLFDRPSGLLTFTIEGVSSHHLSGPFKTLGTSPLHDVLPTTEPHTTFSVIGSVLTGVAPNAHGITNDLWPEAVGNTKSPYSAGNFFDAVADLRVATIVSASSSLESALAVSPSIFRSFTSTFHWDRAQKTFGGGASGYSFGTKDFPTLFQQLAEVTGRRILYSPSDSHVSIFTQDNQPVVFDLTDEDDETFLAEILFVLNAANQEPLSFFAFHFSSPKDILNKYSSSSPEYQTALFLIDAVISKMKDSYDSTFASLILYFPCSYAHSEVSSAIHPLIAQDLNTPSGMLPLTAFRSFLPHIFLASSPSRTQFLCTLIRQTLSTLSHPIDVVCDDGSTSKRATFQNQSEPSSLPEHESNSTNNFSPPADKTTVSEVHIVLWLALTLIIGLTYSCLQLADSDEHRQKEYKAAAAMVDYSTRTQKV